MSPDELSQEDIDALLSGSGFGGDEAKTEKSQSGGTPSDSAILSQNELDAVLTASGDEQAQLPSFQDFSADESRVAAENPIDLLYDVHLNVKIELGHCEMYIEDVLKLGEGSVVELDKLAGDPVDILVNDKLVAKGEILVLNDQFCVRITDIVSPRERLDATLK